ncbi:MAG: MaoC family dehydratase N-terminal domain-containing protein [Gammaproteobacteria bacterium]|nr:MaoC family dehydratase N-terminal domain-containing protein [Gammaproteobacteria bacterium]
MAEDETDKDIREAREQFLNVEFDEKTFEIDPDVTVEYARYCGETAARFLDRSDSDFQAPPTFVASLSGRRMFPEGYPRFSGVGMDAGKGVECLAPIRPPCTLIGKAHIHDIYTKTGRSGRMVFTVTRLEFFTEDGTHVANADSRQVVREKS